MRTLLMLAALGWSLTSTAQDRGCEDWLTLAADFWESASIEDVNRCLDAGADVNAKGAGGVTPLHLASGQGAPEIVTLLLDANADVNARDFTLEDMPLDWAITAGNPEIVSLLLGAGADVNARGGILNDTPLDRAISRRNPEIVSLLLGAGADMNAWSGLLRATPLDRAISLRNPEIVSLLLGAGAETNMAKVLRDAGALHSSAVRERFELWAACKPMAMGVSLQVSGDDAIQGLTEETISAAVESRLRSARLYDSEGPSFLLASVLPLSSEMGDRRAGWAYSIRLTFIKGLRDAAHGYPGIAGTWERSMIGITPVDSAAESILNLLRGYMDEFLTEYLRVNEDSCE